MSKFNCGSRVRYEDHHFGEVNAYVVHVSKRITTCGDPFSSSGLSLPSVSIHYHIKHQVNGRTIKKHDIPETYLKDGWL